MSRGVSVKLKGFDELVKLLKNYPKKEGKKALRKAVRAGTAVLRAAVKKETPVDEGVLRRAQDFKIVGKGFRVSGIVGANVDKLREAHAEDPARPVNIDWLVEEGHIAPDGSFVPPSGSMRRVAANAMPQAEAKATQVLRDAMNSIGS